jgi:DNA-binding NarL/FixJ family response regulator
MSVPGGPPSNPADPSDGLAAVVALRRLADRLEDSEVERALAMGWSWSEIAEALGVTRQAVHKKHARRLVHITHPARARKE